jgi:hypothetical protein
MKEKRGAYRVLVGTPEEEISIEDAVVDMRIIDLQEMGQGHGLN